jgi:DNA-directed RNA polymerase subunit RPC12/RpoP
LYFNGDIGNRCPRCGSKNIEEGNNEYFTSTGRYKTIRCKSCGGLGRDRFADITTEQRRELRRTLAR